MLYLYYLSELLKQMFHLIYIAKLRGFFHISVTAMLQC